MCIFIQYFTIQPRQSILKFIDIGMILNCMTKKKETGLSQVNKRAAYNRAAREEDIRERLQSMGLLNQITGIQSKLMDLSVEMDAITVTRLAKASDNCFKLLNKIIGDRKSVDVIRRTEDIITIDQLSSHTVEQMRGSILQSLGVSEKHSGLDIAEAEIVGGAGEKSDRG